MKGLVTLIIRYQPIVAPVVMIGMLALTAVGAQFLDNQHAPVWLKWVIGVPYIAFTGFVSMVLTDGDVDDGTEND